MINFRKIVGDYSFEYPALDPTTPYYEFLTYCLCCASLEVPNQPRLGRYMAYRRYLKEIGIL